MRFLYSSVKAPDILKSEYRNVYNNVIVTMSSTPSRIENLPTVLQNIWPIVKEIHLNLPERFRDKDPYSIESISKIQSIIKNLKIFWFSKDIGPIMKTLPTFKRFRDRESNWILSLDDDVIYEASIIKDLASIDIANTVYSGTVHDEIFDNKSSMRLIYGVSGIAWPSTLVSSLINGLELLSSQKGCVYHDDYVHSIVLNYFKINVEQRSWSLIKQKEIQFSDDALLWMNRGLQTEQCLSFASNVFGSGQRRQNAWERFLTFVMWD